MKQKNVKLDKKELNNLGYIEKEVTFSTTKAMFLGIVCALPFIFTFGFFYRIFLIEQAYLTDVSGISFYVVFLGIIAVSTIIHELLHGVGWAISSKKGWSIIHFNINVLMPSCACKIILSQKKYLFGVLSPFVVLGIGSIILLVVYPGTISVLTMAINFGLAGADLVIAFYIIREKGALIVDHPTKAGYIAYRK